MQKLFGKKREQPSVKVDPQSPQPLADLREIPELAEIIGRRQAAITIRNVARRECSEVTTKLFDQLFDLIGYRLMFTSVIEPYFAYRPSGKTLQGRYREHVVGELQGVDLQPEVFPTLAGHGDSRDMFAVRLIGTVSQKPERYYVTSHSQIGFADNVAVAWDVMQEHFADLREGL